MNKYKPVTLEEFNRIWNTTPTEVREAHRNDDSCQFRIFGRMCQIDSNGTHIAIMLDQEGNLLPMIVEDLLVGMTHGNYKPTNQR